MMLENTTPISREALLAEANKIIHEHEDYMHGMHATDVEQKNDVLIFKGDYFLDENGLPTPKSNAIFNMFKHLAHVLSSKYHLEE